MKLSPEVDFFPAGMVWVDFYFGLGKPPTKSPMLCFSAWHFSHFAYTPVQDFADWM